MKVLATLPKVHSMKHVVELRDLCNKTENSVTSLKDCDVPTNTYGNLLIGVIFERIPQELKVITSRSFKNNVWNLGNLLEIFKQELMVRETLQFHVVETRIKKRIVFYIKNISNIFLQKKR